MDEKRENARYGRALREHWMYIVVTIAFAVAGALAHTRVTEPLYEASADVLVSPVTSGTLVGLPVLRDSLFGRSVVTAARLTKSPQVASRVRDSLHLAQAPSAVSALVTVTPQEQSDILTITGTSGSPEGAAKIANAFAQALLVEQTDRFHQELVRVIDRLSRRLRLIDNRSGSAEAAALSGQLADLRALPNDRDPTLSIVSRAVAPSAPTSPRPLLSVAVAAVIGLLLGVAIALGLETVNPLLMRAESLAERDAPPILTRMPRLKDGEAQAALSDLNQIPPELRASIRTLWANLGSLHPNPQAKTLLMTSVDAGEGSPFVAALFAVVMARAGMSVILIDADLERAPLADIFDRQDPSIARLGQILASGDASVILSPVEPLATSGRLRVLLSGPEDRHLTEWLPPDRLAELVVQLKHQVDAIVVAAPPPPAAETSVLTELADVAIITVAVGRTRRDRLNRLREALVDRGLEVAGFVVLERPSLLTRVARAPSKPSVQRRWA